MPDLTQTQSDFVRKYLGAGGRSASEDAGPSEAFVARWRTARDNWQRAVETVDGQIAQLQGVLKSYDDPELREIGEYGLNAMTGNHKVLMMATIQDITLAGGAPDKSVIGAAGKRIAAFDKHLAGDARVKAVDANPFGVKMSVADTLRASLANLDTELKSAG